MNLDIRDRKTGYQFLVTIAFFTTARPGCPLLGSQAKYVLPEACTGYPLPTTTYSGSTKVFLAIEYSR